MMKLVNQCLEDIGETPITKRKLQSKKYSEQKLEHVTANIFNDQAWGQGLRGLLSPELVASLSGP